MSAPEPLRGVKASTVYRPYLVRGLNWLGDAVMSLPAMAALARAGIPMRVLTRSASAAVYKGLPMVSDVIIEERGLAGRLKTVSKLLARRFSGALLLPNSLSSALTAFASLIGDRTGYARDLRSIFLSRAVPVHAADLRSHQSFYFLRLIEALGLDATFTRPLLNPPPPDPAFELPEGFKLAIAPGAAYGGAKRWPASNFAQAASLILASRPGTAIVLGGPGEAAAAAEVSGSSFLRAQKVINLAGLTSLSQAISVLSRCHLTLSNDSGLMHLSGALDVPVVAVFGPTDPMTTSPLSRRFTILRAPAPCSPCLKRECPRARRICLEELTPSMAAEAADKLLSPFQTGRGAVIWTPADGFDWPSANLPPNTRLIAAQSQMDAIKNLAPPPPGALIIPKPIEAPKDWAEISKRGQISPASSIWMGDTPESLRPAARLGGGSILIMTERAMASLPALRDEAVPLLAAPDPSRAFQWLAAMAS